MKCHMKDGIERSEWSDGGKRDGVETWAVSQQAQV